MALIAITSVGGAPGATTSTLGWTLNWGREALMAECSPSGGTVVPGFLRSQLPPQFAQRNLWNFNVVAMERGQESARQSFPEHVVPLGESPMRSLLPGITDPFLAPQLSPSWPTLTTLLRSFPGDVLADVGPLGLQAPFQLLQEADLVVVVMRPTMVQTTSAIPRLGILRKALGATAELALCVIGSVRPKVGDDLNYGLDVVTRNLGPFELVMVLPNDPRVAAKLSDGVKGPRNIEVSALMREIRRTADVLKRHVDAKRSRLAPQQVGDVPAPAYAVRSAG